MRLDIERRGISDIVAQIAWLDQHSEIAGKKAARRILETITLLSLFPDLGIEVAQDIREKPVGFGRDGFVVQYARRPKRVTVLRVRHSRQNR